MHPASPPVTASFHAPRRHGRGRAFTLVELLTVIAIVAILAAIILTTVGRVRHAARQANGLSNIRQVGIGLLLYGQENHGKFPAYNTPLSDGTPAYNWAFVVYEGMASEPVNNYTRLPDWFFDPLIERAASSVPTHFAIQCFADPNQPAALNECANFRRWTSPSRLIMAADTGLDANGFPHGDLWGLDGNAAAWTGANGGTPDPTLAGLPINPGTNQPGNIRWDDDGRAKFVFGDGRVARLAQGEVTKGMVNPLLQQ